MQAYPLTPKIQAKASLENGQAPLWYEVADTKPITGSTKFAVTYDVRQVPGAKGAILEFSAPTYNFADALYFTGDFGATNTDVNNFTNPNGDRFDSGDNYGQPGGVARGCAWRHRRDRDHRRGGHRAGYPGRATATAHIRCGRGPPTGGAS